MRIAGSTFIYLAETDSTNLYASRLLAEGNPADGTVVIAGHQTAGRGSRGKHWITKDGDAVLMSLITYPVGLSVDAAPRYSLASGWAIISAIKRINPLIQAQLKWPNDVLIEGRKLCGVLIETQIRGSFVKSLITGIGINFKRAPEVTGLTAAALSEFVSELPDLQNFVRDILCDELDAVHHQLNGQGWPDLLDEINVCLFRKNELVRFADLTESVIRQGVIRAIDVDGKLMMECGKQLLHFRREEIEVAW